MISIILFWLQMLDILTAIQTTTNRNGVMIITTVSFSNWSQLSLLFSNKST
jgi:hypothetical protein